MPKFYADVDINSPAVTISSITGNKPLLTLTTTDDSLANNSSEIKFFKNSASEAGEDLGLITWRGLDSGGSPTRYCEMRGEIVVNTDGGELGQLSLTVRNEGSYLSGLVVKGTATTGEVDVDIAKGAASTTTIAGDLSITTGLLLDGADITTIQTDGESFVDNNTSLMTSGAIADYVTANGSGVTFASEAEVEAGTEASKAISPDTLRDGEWNRTIGLNVGTTPGDGHGDVVTWGSIPSGGAIVAGGIYYYSSTSEWVATDANTANSDDAKGLLGVALGTTMAEGILLRGTVCLVAIEGTEVVGSPLFLSGTDYTATADAPTGDGDTIRIVGHLLSSTNNIIWFNPDNTFVEYTT